MSILEFQPPLLYPSKRMGEIELCKHIYVRDMGELLWLKFGFRGFPEVSPALTSSQT